MKRKCILSFASIFIIAFMFISCDNGTNGSTQLGNTDPKSIRIENINDLTGNAGIWVFSTLPPANEYAQNTAIGAGSISGNVLACDLSVPRDNTYITNTKWTGNGDYYVALIPIAGNTWQGDDAKIFTNGGASPVKVTFNDKNKTLNYGDFKEYQ